MTKPSQTKTVLETILEWSQTRPHWQRDALRRIVIKGKIEPIDIAEVLDLCKNSKILLEDGSIILPKPLDANHLPANLNEGNSVSLTSIQNVRDVNHLAINQNLNFRRDGLNIVYGDNGAGKSGYVRILKRMCRARHAGDIQPNAFAETLSSSKASATISHVISDDEVFENWVDNEQSNSVLTAISVFDVNCAAVHLTEKNEVAFRPFGIDIPDELANLCQQLKLRLEVDQAGLINSRDNIFINGTWKPYTTVGSALNSLTSKSSIESFKTLAQLDDLETARYASLKQDLAKNPVQIIREQKIRIPNLDRLKNLLHSLNILLSDENTKELFDLAEVIKNKRDANSLLASDSFKDQHLKSVGSDTWRILWESARKYSKQDAYPEQEFPYTQNGAVCVLCQQPLSVEAHDRLHSFEGFVKSDVAKGLQETIELFATKYHPLKTLKIDTNSIKAELQELGTNKELQKYAIRFIAIARLRRYLLNKSFIDGLYPTLPSFDISQLKKIESLIEDANNYVVVLESNSSAESRRILEAELDELSDRVILSGLLPKIEVEIARLNEIKIISEKLAETNTQAITKLGNQIADDLITPKLKDQFKDEIAKLSAEKVKVDIIRSGGKYGSPQYQLKINTSQNVKVTSILSEGEQTCVSFAAFLAELATSSHKSALVFDDPVTSLDHKWRDKIAKRLADEANVRQIIVFTHDLTFIHDLLGYREKQGDKNTKCISLNRGPSGTGVVSDGLPWTGSRVEDRIDKIEKELSAAKVFYSNDDESRYRDASIAIYGKIRATWERALEDIAFQGIIQRHRDYIDHKNLKKVTVLLSADCDTFELGFKKCSDIIEAHDHSRARNAIAPTPDAIRVDIDCLKNWVADLRLRQKAI